MVISQKEWEAIGNKKGWTKTAALDPSGFQGEGKDPMEDIEKREQFEAQQAFEDPLKKPSATYTSEILGKITKSGIFGKKLSSMYMASGSAGLYAYGDNNFYVITVEPAAYSRFGPHLADYYKNDTSQQNAAPEEGDIP